MVIFRFCLGLSFFLALLCVSGWLGSTYFVPLLQNDPSAEHKQIVAEDRDMLIKKLPYESIGEIHRDFEDGYLETDNVPSQQYTLEIDEFGSLELAERKMRELEQLGIEAYFTRMAVDGAGVIYRVRQGIFSSKGLAEKAKKSLENRANIATKVIALR